MLPQFKVKKDFFFELIVGACFCKRIFNLFNFSTHAVHLLTNATAKTVLVLILIAKHSNEKSSNELQ